MLLPQLYVHFYLFASLELFPQTELSQQRLWSSYGSFMHPDIALQKGFAWCQLILDHTG